jgi:hypothetical protein
MDEIGKHRREGRATSTIRPTPVGGIHDRERIAHPACVLSLLRLSRVLILRNFAGNFLFAIMTQSEERICS